MARLTALPSIDIIKGFRGVLDFYMWKGLPCVRRWPRRRPGPGTEAQIAAWAIFGQISTSYRLLAPLALAAFQEAAKDQPRTARDLYISAMYGLLHERAIPAPPPPPEEEMYDAYVCLRDLKPAGTNAGSSLAATWNHRDLNDEQADTKDICTLAANQFTLAAGTYRALISCTAYYCGRHQIRLYNVTDAATILLGTSEWTYNVYAQTRSQIAGRFTIESAKILRIEHYTQNAITNYGLGHEASPIEEVYALAEFWREIPPP